MIDDCTSCPDPKTVFAAIWKGTLGWFAGRAFWIWYHREQEGNMLIAGGLGYLGAHFIAELM
jgi:hypothetical protein